MPKCLTIGGFGDKIPLRGERMADSIEIIAHIENDYTAKFGIPRQSGLIPELKSKIVFKPKYRREEALRGLEGYSHIWLIWKFSESERKEWSPTVRPPRLGGNKRMGVFATRSPFRPNPLGLSAVKLEEIRKTENEGTVLIVSGADLMNGTPIYDIKPYLPFSDSVEDAAGGFAEENFGRRLEVIFPDIELSKIEESKRQSVISLLAEDPRPAYTDDPERIFGFFFGKWEIKFTVKEKILTVISVKNI